ncbi:MAG: cytochrome P450 [Rhizomicrobium sp.]
MTNYDAADWFTDLSLIQDPFPYYEYLRAKGPVVREPYHGVIVVTGYEEGLAVYRDDEHFSSINAPSGPIPALPFTPDAYDIGPQIEKYRDQIAYSEWLVTRDRPAHTAYRSLLMGLITPARLKKNEEFMWRLADRQIGEFIDRDGFEVIAELARPFTVMVVADLLGVPEKDHKEFCENYGPVPAQVDGSHELANNPLDFLSRYFTRYIEERRRNPLKDGLSELAHAKFPDGTTPTLSDVVNMAEFLFSAGQDTSARLITAALRFLGERPELQRQLRQQRDLIPNFLEEVLRVEPPVKCNFRVARVPVKVGDLDVTPGTTVMLLLGAINRDPRQFERPGEFLLDRANARDHLSFSRGIHACAGAPLARAEGFICLQRMFDHTENFCVSDAKHGPAGARRYTYEPTYLLRGLQELHLDVTPQTDARSSPRAA